MNEKRAYVTISYFVSWGPEDLDLPPDVDEATFKEAFEEALDDYLASGDPSTPPDEIITEICGFEKGFKSYDL